MVGLQDPRAAERLSSDPSSSTKSCWPAPRDPQLRRDISEVQMNLAMYLMFTRGSTAAVPAFQRVKSIDEQLLSEFPNNPERLTQLTEHRIQMSLWLQNAGLRTARRTRTA